MVIHPLLIVVYLLLATIVAFLGRHRVVGFPGIFILSILLTPFVMALILLATLPKSDH